MTQCNHIPATTHHAERQHGHTPENRDCNTDLYRCFMDRTWRSTNADGMVRLIHPESHFTEARAEGLRREAYQRLRRHWQFRNSSLVLFEIRHTRGSACRSTGVSCASVLYMPPRSTGLRPWNVRCTTTAAGPEPGIKDDEDQWDTRRHAARLMPVDAGVLATWAKLIDDPGPPLSRGEDAESDHGGQPTRARPVRLRLPVGVPFLSRWTSGWHESADRPSGYFAGRSAVPDSLRGCNADGPAFHCGDTLC